jgi:hypothetical protein
MPPKGHEKKPDTHSLRASPAPPSLRGLSAKERGDLTVAQALKNLNDPKNHK